MTAKGVAHGVLRTLSLEGAAMRARDRQLARRASKQMPTRVAADGLPVPPGELINQVSGMPSEEIFLASGADGRNIIADVLATNGIDIEHMDRLLDFGVGCGRIARHWQDVSAELHGCDYNPALVEWCNANLPHVTAVCNQLNPPLPYGDQAFDFVYALSVFTHLTEPQQRPWSAELRRVTRLDGTVLFTTHGPTFEHSDQRFTAPEVAARLGRGELVIFEPDAAGRNYCAALHPRSWVAQNMLDGFELLQYIERGAVMNGGQDIYLVRRVA
jgi:hypothetical protein